MIHMRAYMTANTQHRLKDLMQWGQLKHEQISQIMLITKESVLGFLKRQLEKGNWKGVQDVLEGKPMTKTGKFLFMQLRDHVASNLIMRLGLRKVIAVGIAIVVLPLVLAKISGSLIGKFRGND